MDFYGPFLSFRWKHLFRDVQFILQHNIIIYYHERWPQLRCRCPQTDVFRYTEWKYMLILIWKSQIINKFITNGSWKILFPFGSRLAESWNYVFSILTCRRRIESSSYTNPIILFTINSIMQNLYKHSWCEYDFNWIAKVQKQQQ